MNVSMLDKKLASVEEVSAAIEAGKVLWLAGDEYLLKSLPKGKWIGGSIPYFMGDQGGETTKQKIYVSELDVKIAKRIQIQFYHSSNIKNIAKDAPDNGFSILLIPAFTQIHQDYARFAPEYEDMFLKPIAGWVTGFHLDDMGSATPIVINGGTGEVSTDRAVTMHVTLAPGKVANVGIVNVARQSDGDTFEFPETGFSASACLINGEQKNLADYLTENKVDTRFPLVANYSGAMINISFQEINTENKTVSFYAPVFNGIQYKLSKPMDDYVNDFQLALPELKNISFCCNCVLNYLHLELEGQKTGTLTGPMTFGEIAYQLLNQTMVYLTIDDE
ncbi:hypothetical protein SPBRAN_1125 [uncultured Candidatus Thioglobus sp.]|nr:hypothetical protein SPBRAN_1125 [uncultured Candidatus Thioglobus sp.]